MPTDRAARLGLVAAALVAVLLFAPRVLDVGPGHAQNIAGSSLARSLAPTGDRAVLDVGRKPAPINPWLFQRPVAERAWAAALLAAMVLVGLTASQRREQVPPRRRMAPLPRATGRRAPPAVVR